MAFRRTKSNQNYIDQFEDIWEDFYSLVWSYIYKMEKGEAKDTLIKCIEDIADEVYEELE